MIKWTKLFPSFFLCSVHFIWAELPAFESFHSNMGELLILPPFVQRGTTTQSSNSPNPVTQELSEYPSDKPPSQSSTDEGIKFQEKSASKQNQLILSDEEIETILFDELGDWNEEVDEIIFEIPDWYKFYAFEMGWGYADNPLGAAYNSQSSSFAELNLESFFLNQKNPQHETLLYLFAEGKNFYQLESEKIAGLILSQLDYSFKPLGSKNSYGLRVQHTFFDQGMDFSELGSSSRSKITSNRSEISPYLKWQRKNGEEAKLELKWSKESLKQFADQNSKFGISAALSNKSSDPLTWEVKVFHIVAKYDDRLPKDGAGNPLSGSLETKNKGISTKFSSSAVEGWTKDLSLGTSIEKVEDNHAGYYNYHRLKTSLEKKFTTESWDNSISFGYNHTRYSDRLVDSMAHFSRDHWFFELGLARELNQDWKTYAKWMHEKDRSNDPDYAFESNFWSIGMSWEK